MIFSDKQDIRKNAKIMKECWEEIYQKCYSGDDIKTLQYEKVKMVGEGKEIEMPKWLINSIRSSLLRSYYPDEQVVLVSLGRMNPEKLDFNPHFFNYGGLYIYLVGACLKIASILNLLTISPDVSYYFLHPDKMGKFFIVGRLLGVLMGGLSVYIIYYLASLAYNRKTGLIAALLMSSVPVIVVYSHYLKPYVFNLPFLLLSFYMAIKILSSEKTSDYILGGVFAGLAGGILLPFGLIFISIPTAHLIKRFFQDRQISTLLSLFEKRIIFSIIASIAAYIMINPYLLVSFKEAFDKYRFLATSLFHFNPTFGHSFYFFKVGLATGLGWPLLTIVTIGVFFSLYKREKNRYFNPLFCLFWLFFY